MKIRFIRFHKDARLPTREHHSDTGADVYMMESGRLKARETRVIPAGFGIEVPNGHSARLQVRTSVAKHGVMIQGCAIDAGYDGEIHIILHNLSDKDFYWDAADRLCYIEVYPTQYPEFVEQFTSVRGNEAFGSTGK